MRTLLIGAVMTGTGIQQAWIEQLREADRLASENRRSEALREYIDARKQAETLADPLLLAITLDHMGHCYQAAGPDPRSRAALRLCLPYRGAGFG